MKMSPGVDKGGGGGVSSYAPGGKHLLIGLGYKARQGKTIVSETLQELSTSVRLYSFAEELKLYCAAHHDELYKKYPNISTKQKPDPIYGYVGMLQHYGTDVMRKKDLNHWVKKIGERLDKITRWQVSVITDVRFPNEAEWVRSRGGYLINIVRLAPGAKRYIDPTRDPKHPSETALDDYTNWYAHLAVGEGELDWLKEITRSLFFRILHSHDDWKEK